MAWEWLEKYLKGTVGQPGSRVGETYESYIPNTPGLFGSGGEYGQGGLFTTFNQPNDPSKGMLDLFSNLPVVAGMEVIQSGTKGKPINEALLPAFKSSLVTTSAVDKVKAAKRKQKFIKDYKDKVPKEDMELFLAFPEKYVTAMLTEKMRTPTIGKEVLALYNESKNLKGEAFDNWYKKLPDSQKFLYDNKIKPNLSGMAAFADAIAKMEEVMGGGDTVIEELKPGFIENIDILVDKKTYKLPDGRIGIWNKKKKGFDFPEN